MEIISLPRIPPKTENTPYGNIENGMDMFVLALEVTSLFVAESAETSLIVSVPLF